MKGKIPVSVFTGFLGSGKTTIILNLIKQLPVDYNVVWLKNEYGDINADSELARENNIQVAEMVNGCLCCVLVGKLHNALTEIISNYSPERIIIETSGTAYPAPIVWEIEKLPELQLDGVITVIDALNFSGYADKSYTATLQAQYTDLMIINKINSINEWELEQKLDDVYELNPQTPKIRTADGVVSKELLLGLDSKLVGEPAEPHHEHHVDEFEVFAFHSEHKFNLAKVIEYLQTLVKYDFYRIKGIVVSEDGAHLLNYVAGRVTTEPLKHYRGTTKLSFMGRGVLLRAHKVQLEMNALAYDM
jgi:G3E family GTPase